MFNKQAHDIAEKIADLTIVTEWQRDRSIYTLKHYPGSHPSMDILGHVTCTVLNILYIIIKS